ncbi:hypothetical protein CW304_16255 [Bacillus sp. UFRGS-B20]|nr:hypothetical protein CW304_16255 [Bacillus sp. UFRGS-B20]
MPKTAGFSIIEIAFYVHFNLCRFCTNLLLARLCIAAGLLLLPQLFLLYFLFNLRPPSMSACTCTILL